MEPNTENTGKREMENGELVVRIKPFRFNPFRLILSLVAVVGSVLIIIGGSNMFGIKQSNVTTKGSFVYYHGLGLPLIGFGVIGAALSVGACYRSLSGHSNKNS